MTLEVKGVCKQFYGNTVLSDVNLAFHEGEIHAIVGENGAGKSTLIKIIGGNYRADAGFLSVDGSPVTIQSQHEAAQLGIHIVYQEYNLVRNMTVLQNILLGREPVGRGGLIRSADARREIAGLAERNGIKVDLDKYAGDLSSAEAKLTEILRACSHEMRMLILDEPTAALDEDDVHSLFQLLRTFRERGIAVIYISHRLEEVFRLCDRVTVLKDGAVVGSWNTNETDRDSLIGSMVGRELKEIFPLRGKRQRRNLNSGETPALQVDHLSDDEHFRDISFELFKGEILGIGGMSGHGQRELIRALFGVHPVRSGTMRVNDSPVEFRHPGQAVDKGLVFLSDDRRNEGLAITQPISRNVAFPSMKKRSTLGVINRSEDTRLVVDLISKLKIKLSSIYENVQGLSGGNQQRVVIAKWLPFEPDILLFHEPTLGIDVGAKAEVYSLLEGFAEEGKSILVVTSDMLELINMTDRILVMYEGALQAELVSEEATEEQVMAAASGN